MAKINWKPGNMIYPLPAVIVTCGNNKNNYNAITIGWTGTICTNPPMTYISVRPERYSYSIIKETKEFVINLTTEQLAKATDYCGVKSGRDVNKFDDMNLTIDKATKIDCPMIVESPVNIECKVTQIVPLGSHHMFMAEVIAVNVDEQYLNKNNKFCLENSKPICYSHGTYFSIGKSLGTFGYSIKKKKKKRYKRK